jgi:hypothetical protein
MTYADHGAERERATRRVAQDAMMRARHAGFDRSAQDQHMKSERAHFAVVGEGTRAAQDHFRVNYARIDWST